MDVVGWIAVAPALLAVAVLYELAVIPPAHWYERAAGLYASTCLSAIPLLSIVPLVALLIALRAGAPRSPAATGAVAGLLAGGLSAALYATHCPDDLPLFVAVWYTLAVGLVTSDRCPGGTSGAALVGGHRRMARASESGPGKPPRALGAHSSQRLHSPDCGRQNSAASDGKTSISTRAPSRAPKGRRLGRDRSAQEAKEEALPRLPAAGSKVVIQRLSRDLGQLEADGPTRFLWRTLARSMA